MSFADLLANGDGVAAAGGARSSLAKQGDDVDSEVRHIEMSLTLAMARMAAQVSRIQDEVCWSGRGGWANVHLAIRRTCVACQPAETLGVTRAQVHTCTAAHTKERQSPVAMRCTCARVKYCVCMCFVACLPWRQL